VTFEATATMAESSTTPSLVQSFRAGSRTAGETQVVAVNPPVGSRADMSAERAERSDRFLVILRRLEMLRREQSRLLNHTARLRETVETLRTERDTLEAAMLAARSDHRERLK
jgi:hypothetical protein